jgi:hemolysin activation/secretion protein
MPVHQSFAQDAPSPPPSSSGGRLVDVNEYRVLGNTLLKPIEIERTVYPYLGRQPLNDVEKARAALEKEYADLGYQAVIVTLPPQTVKGGVIILQVTEAQVGNLTISGQRFTTEQEILRGVPSLQTGSSPNFNDVNREVVALNSQSADIEVTPQLKAGSQPDHIDVDLAVADKRPLHGGLELNNNYSRDTDPLRVQANVSYGDLWHLGHSISAYYDVSPQNRTDAEVYVLTYSAPIPGTDARLSLTGLKSDSDVTTVGSTGVLGKGQSVTLNGFLPLPALGGVGQDFQLGFAYKHFIDTITLPGQSDSTPITYYPLSLAYDAHYTTDLSQVSLSGAMNFAFRGLGSSSQEYDNKRYRAFGNFIYFHGQGSLQRELPYGLQAYFEADGQISNEPLISNEQFAAGGNGSVRGYLQAEILGDSGYHLSAELRAPDLAPYLGHGKWFDTLRLLAFVDGARTWLQSPLPDQESAFRLLSVGPGIRTKVKFVNFDADWGFPLVTSDSTRSGHSRFQFRLYTQF